MRVSDCGALTAFGDETASLGAMLDGRTALALQPVLGSAGGGSVPLALCAGHGYDETIPPSWFRLLAQLARRIPGDGWGTPRRPVVFTSSNFGVGSLHAFQIGGGIGHLDYGTPHLCVDQLATLLGWGPCRFTFSHACVSAHLGLLHAERLLAANLADAVLVFSFDFISPFVAGGFHALKILNPGFPSPYHAGETGSIGLGDGAAFAVFTRDEGDFRISNQTLHNEMQHFTANQPDGGGFTACLAPISPRLEGRRLWLKGHGTGTLEAGRLEAEVLAAHFPNVPLVSWKGALGHTLGSCGLVEMVLAIAAMREGRSPGTVGGHDPCFSPQVALAPFNTAEFDAVLCTSNAFGGAHAAFLVSHD